MLGLLQSASALRSFLFDSFPIYFDYLPSMTISSTRNTRYNDIKEKEEFEQYLRDLAFDAYESDADYIEEKSHTETTLINYSAFDSYDWAFSFRESSKTEDRLVLEVALERFPKADSDCDTLCISTPCSTSSEMTLLHSEHNSYSSASSAATSHRASITETAELISEEEQNMILAAIIASKDDFDYQIPNHIREEMEHAEFVVAMEESAQYEKQRNAIQNKKEEERSRDTSSAHRSPVRVSTPTREAPTPSSFNTSPVTPRTPRSLHRRDSDIPWRAQQGEQVPGESEAQQRFRELLQMQAVAAASVANASAGRFGSNISGISEYEWAGHH